MTSLCLENSFPRSGVMDFLLFFDTDDSKSIIESRTNPACFFSIFSACGLGLILGSCSFWTPSMHLLSNILASLLLLLSGANYSLSVMPSWLRPIADYFPLTRGVQLTKAILNDGDYSMMTRLLTEEFLLGCVYFIVGILAIRLAEYLARVKGTMELSYKLIVTTNDGQAA